MDFLSKVSAKAGETFQTIKDSDVTKKAKNYAGIPGLQVQIGKCESQIKKAYEEIGKAYFEAHEQDADGEYAEQVEIIKENQKKIGQLKSEIEEKKNGEEDITDADAESVSVEKVCPICGRSVSDDAAFCSVCGHQF
jgi:peptidoglycan hydrolase CwlO-like protein